MVTDIAPRTFRKHQRRGQALVETAIVIIVVVTMAMGIADLGLYTYRYVQAANCVREAARRAVVRADDAENPPYCVDAGLKPAVTPGYKTLPYGAEVTAAIDKPHSWMAIGSLIPGIGATAPIRARTSMRMEGQKV